MHVANIHEGNSEIGATVRAEHIEALRRLIRARRLMRPDNIAANRLGMRPVREPQSTNAVPLGLSSGNTLRR